MAMSPEEKERWRNEWRELRPRIDEANRRYEALLADVYEKADGRTTRRPPWWRRLLNHLHGLPRFPRRHRD